MRKKLCIFLIIILFLLTGCKAKESDKKTKKLEAELDYISTKIFNLANKLNNVSFRNYEITSKETEIKNEESESASSDGGEEATGGSSEEKNGKNPTIIEMKNTTILDISEDEIDWENIKMEIEIINNIWSVISIDLKNEKVADNEIEDFNNSLNQTIISIKNEDMEGSLKNLRNLYSIIPTFMNYIYTDNIERSIGKTKAELVKSYVSASLKDWDNALLHATNAQNIFFEISNNKDGKDNKEFKIEKVERLIQNLNNSAKLKDLQLFLVHYKTLIENIDTL